MTKYLVLAAVLLGTTACGDTWGQRAVTGGGIGAGSGAIIGALTPARHPAGCPGRHRGRRRRGCGDDTPLLTGRHHDSFHGLRSISKVQADRFCWWSCQ